MNNPNISFFRKPITNTYPYRNISLEQVYKLIKSDRYKEQTKILRDILLPKSARKYKAERFDYVTFSGTFAKRADKDLIQHSNLLCLDFDHLKNLKDLKQSLLTDDYFETQLLFTSPSGDGIKWIIEIDIQKETHQNWFQAISNYLKSTYQVIPDTSGKDISRACFLPHDADVFINPKHQTKKQ